MTYRPRQFRLGAMRHRINVQHFTEAVSQAGDVERTWTNLVTNEPSTFDSVSGGEMLRGRQVESGITAVFTVHYRSAYAPENQVVYDGTTYGVIYVKPIEGGRRYVELWCKS